MMSVKFDSCFIKKELFRFLFRNKHCLSYIASPKHSKHISKQTMTCYECEKIESWVNIKHFIGISNTKNT